MLLEAARRPRPTPTAKVITHLRQVADSDGADGAAGAMSAAGCAGLDLGRHGRPPRPPRTRGRPGPGKRDGPWPTPPTPRTLQRRSTPGGCPGELARLTSKPASSPGGGVRPQLLITVDLDSLVGPGGGDPAARPLAPEACRRLACDSAVTRVLEPHPTDHGGGHGPSDDHDPGDEDGLAAAGRDGPVAPGPGRRPQPTPDGASRSSPLPNERPAVRDGGCVFPDCARPLDWCDGHHWSTGSTAAPPTSPTSPYSAEPTIGRSMRAAGNPPAAPTGFTHPTPPTTATASTRPTPTASATSDPARGARPAAHRRLHQPQGGKATSPPARRRPPRQASHGASNNPGPPCQVSAWGPRTQGPPRQARPRDPDATLARPRQPCW